MGLGYKMPDGINGTNGTVEMEYDRFGFYGASYTPYWREGNPLYVAGTEPPYEFDLGHLGLT